MAIEAPLSSYKKKNMIIIACVLIGVGGWFLYDGYYNQTFIDEHTVDGVANSTLNFNRKSPPFFIGAGLLLGGWFFVVKNKKIIAGEEGLKIGKETIHYEKIEKINKTNFDSKGYFIVTCTDQNGQQKELKLSDRTYDNLGAILDHLVAKISE